MDGCAYHHSPRPPNHVSYRSVPAEAACRWADPARPDPRLPLPVAAAPTALRACLGPPDAEVGPASECSSGAGSIHRRSCRCKAPSSVTQRPDDWRTAPYTQPAMRSRSCLVSPRIALMPKSTAPPTSRAEGVCSFRTWWPTDEVLSGTKAGGEAERWSPPTDKLPRPTDKLPRPTDKLSRPTDTQRPAGGGG
jgi:hypothetical protein